MSQGTMRAIGRTGRRSGVWTAMALCVVAMTVHAIAAPRPIHTVGTPRVAMVIPDGFDPAPVPRGTRVFAMYHRERDEVLLILLRLPGPLPQGRHDDLAWRAAREADPFAFQDRDVRFHALGFDIEGARGESHDGEVPAVRWLALVPTDVQGIAVCAVAPAPHGNDARLALEQVLASMRGGTNWRTPLRRAIDYAAGAGFVAALVLSIAYAIVAMTWFRGKADRARTLRGAWLAVAGVGWILFALFWLVDRSFGARAFGFAVFSFGVLLGAQGLGMLRRRPV